MNSDNKGFLTNGKGMNAVFAAVLIALLTAADQWTKAVSAEKLKNEPYVLIRGVLEFRYLENHGMAFSLLQNQMTFFFIGTVVFFSVALYFWFRLPKTRKMRWLRLILIVLAAGGLGNFIDRCRFRYVRDFIYFSLIDFPIFNVADIFVTVSATVLVLLILFYYKDEDFEGVIKKREKGSPDK